MAKPHIHVVIAANHISTAVQTGLQQLRVSTSFWPLPAALNDGLRNTGDAVLIVADSQAPDIVSRLEVLLDRLAERARPTLLVVLNGSLPRKPAPPALLPLVTTVDPRPEDLIARLTTLLELRGSFAALTAVGEEVRAQHEQLQTRFRDQLRVASLVQRELNAPALKRLGRVTFHTLFRPVEAISGDVLEVAQIDDRRVGFFLADASGHGLPAAMLTMFIKRALNANEQRQHGTAPCPAAALARLNEDLCRSNLTECPFVAAICGVLDVHTLELRFSRAGAPYPLIRTADGEVTLRRSEGSVLGVLPGATFPSGHVQLSPGDSFLAYSDGLDRVMRPHLAAERLADAFRQAAAEMTGESTLHAIGGSSAAGAISAIATGPSTAIMEPDLAISTTPWFELFGQEGAAAAIEQARVRIDSLRRMGEKLDDLTLLAFEVDLES